MKCCFIGHRKVIGTPKLMSRLKTVISQLIKEGVTDFIFGDHSEFNDLCYEAVTELKKSHSHIRRIHFRTNYPSPNDYTKQFLIEGYEESLYPNEIISAGKTVYLKRNQAMIKESNICVFYYNEMYQPKQHNRRISSANSGTRFAYKYAKSQNKKIINLFTAV